MNLANKLTLSRIFLVPLFMVFVIPFPNWVLESGFLKFLRPELLNINWFINQYGGYIAAIIFIIAASTDGVDGYIARKRKQITVFGKFLDPIADKLLVTAALIALVQRNDVTGWAAMIILSREFIVTGLRLIAAGEGTIIAASNLGKIKTVLQMVAIVACLISKVEEHFPDNRLFQFIFEDITFDRYAMLLAVIITIYSGYDYIKKNIKLIDYKK